jgi:hypothetical protein
MTVGEIQVGLIFNPHDGDRERAEEDAQALLDDLIQIDISGVGHEVSGRIPPGVRGVGADSAGALLIALGSSGATLPLLVGVIRDWLGRKGSGTVRLKIGSDEVELTHASGEMQQRALDEFLKRHPT